MKRWIIVLGVLLFTGCDLLKDDPFTVETWSPLEGAYENPGSLAISLGFSRDPDRRLAEHAFSLLEDGSPIGGSFSWEGRRMVFLPRLPFKDNASYRMSLSSAARDSRGFSLDHSFSTAFSTKAEAKPIRLLSTVPEDGGFLSEARQELRLTFSAALKPEEIQGSCVLSPAVPGVWRLDASGCVLSFQVRDSWPLGMKYTLRVSELYRVEDGPISFKMGDDSCAPALVEAWELDREGARLRSLLLGSGGDGGGGEAGANRQWERDHGLELVFSEEVEGSQVVGLCAVEPAAALILEGDGSWSTSVRLRFADVPAYGSDCILRVAPGVWDRSGNESVDSTSVRFVFDGPNSKPPALFGIRLPRAPGAGPGLQEPRAIPRSQPLADLALEAVAGGYPYGVGVPTWIELYFDLAPGAEVDLFSLMERFKLSASNNALYFSPRRFRSMEFAWADAHPGWETYSRVQVDGLLTNYTDPGMVYLDISRGLKDTLGNADGEALRFPLVK